MTLFQLLMLGASAYFAFKIYEHIQTLEEPNKNTDANSDAMSDTDTRYISNSKIQEILDEADNAFDDGDMDKALGLLLEYETYIDNNSEVLFKIGYILQTKDDDKALDYYKKALELDKENEYIHNSIASIYRKNKELTSAKMHLNASIDINGENPVTYYNYGNLLVDMQNIEGAISMYEKALELDPEFEQARSELENIRNI